MLNLYCVDTVGGGGTEVWVRSLIKSLADNYQVRLISGSLDPNLHQFVSHFVRIRLPGNPAFLRVFLYSVISTCIPRLNAEIVHVVGAITFRKSSLNTIHFYHKENFRLRQFTIYRNKSKIRVLNRLIYTNLCIMMERVIYSKFYSSKLASVSPEMCALLERDFSRTISLTHNGIDPLEIRINSLQKTQPYLLFVGGDWERKGLMDVIEGLEKIKHSYPAIKLYVAGSGSKSVYVATAKRLRVDENIIWLGLVPRNQIPYSPKSILISASHFEVSPLIFLEAAMAGAPVVSYPVFGTLEASNEGYLRTCEPSPNGLALEVTRLLSDEQEMRKLSNAGIMLRKTRNWQLMVKETIDLYPRLT